MKDEQGGISVGLGVAVFALISIAALIVANIGFMYAQVEPVDHALAQTSAVAFQASTSTMSWLSGMTLGLADLAVISPIICGIAGFLVALVVIHSTSEKIFDPYLDSELNPLAEMEDRAQPATPNWFWNSAPVEHAVLQCKHIRKCRPIRWSKHLPRWSKLRFPTGLADQDVR